MKKGVEKMDIRLKQMKLRNFKGIKKLDIDFGLVDTSIYGKNATGKTTIADSFSWLFFNKDSSGSADFDVKTKTADGEYLHNLEHSVECVVEVNGLETTFKKIFKEKYTKQRGSTTATFTGHTTDYFVDDVPRKKKEYDETVNQLFDSNIFPMITDPFYFNTRMKWQDRRKMLIDICGDIPDSEVIAQNGDLKPLESMINGKSVDDLRLQLKSQMKPINDELKVIPIKINEAQLAIPNEIEEFDEEKYKFINEKINEFEAKKQTALSGGAIADLETKLINLRNKKLLIEQEIPNTKKLKEELYELEFNKNKILRQIEEKTNVVEITQRSIDRNQEERNELRVRFASVKETNFEGNTVCPTCGQDLPKDSVQKAIEQFNLSKSKTLEKINEQGVCLKNQCDELLNNIKLCEIEHEQLLVTLKDAEQVVLDKEKEIKDIENNFKASQEPKIVLVDSQIKDVENEINLMKQNSSSVAYEYDEKINALKEEKAKMDSIVASEKIVENQKKRIEELEAREKQLADEYSLKDQMLYLTDLFIKTKVEMLTQKINSHFKLCSFKLFEEQINGGLNECCEVTVSGVNYSDLNNAMKINAGLDVINTICDYSNTYTPIFIDNAESVNKALETTSQQIRMYVTEDEKLIVEN